MKKLKLLPGMRCDTGCGDCCGFAPCTEQEYRKVLWVAKCQGVTPKLQGQVCPYYQGDRCQVYEARPLACRLFGHQRAMRCSRGYNTNVSDEQGQRMVLANGKPTRLLHEALIDAGLVANLDDLLGAPFETEETP